MPSSPKALIGLPLSSINISPLDGRSLLLQGSKVALSLMYKEDVPIISRWYQNLEFTAYVDNPGEFHTLEMQQDAYEKASRIKPEGIDFAIVLLSTGQLVGFGGLFDITRAMTATVFVGIGESDLWGKGYGTEALRLICEYGFFFRSLHNIKLAVNGYNTRAIRVYRRFGFKLAGRIRGAVMLNGLRYDQVIMDMLREEFEYKYVTKFKSVLSK